MRRLLVLAAIAALSSCNDYPNQLVVTFDTDAPLPAQGGLDPLDGPTPLFDRLRIDVLQPDGTPCSGCTNDFAVTRDLFAATHASIGIPLPAASGWTLRARLYLSRFASNGEPNLDSTIDTLVSLPSADQNPGSAGVFLSTDTAGVVATAPNALGEVPSTSAVGTWPGATRVGCDESVPHPSNTACVPGGAYWMGLEDGQTLSGRSGSWHRLAVMSPHYIDVAEVTVGAFRAQKRQPQGVNIPDVTDGPAYCTFTTAAGPYESLPVNCLNASNARSYCKALGGDLPTSAQFERLATRLGRTPYVWGLDPPTCSDAIFSNCSTSGCYNGDTTPDVCYTVPSPSPLKSTSGALGGPVPPRFARRPTHARSAMRCRSATRSWSISPQTWPSSPAIADSPRAMTACRARAATSSSTRRVRSRPPCRYAEERSRRRRSPICAATSSSTPSSKPGRRTSVSVAPTQAWRSSFRPQRFASAAATALLKAVLSAPGPSLMYAARMFASSVAIVAACVARFSLMAP